MSDAKKAAEEVVHGLMTHPMMRWDHPVEDAIEFMAAISFYCGNAVKDLRMQEGENAKYTASEIEMANTTIKTAFLNNELSKLIGEALGKHAVVVTMIDARGAVLVVGASKPDVPDAERNGIMMRKIESLMNERVPVMMQEAGKEIRESAKEDHGKQDQDPDPIQA